jgi:hypothetical protein
MLSKRLETLGCSYIKLGNGWFGVKRVKWDFGPVSWLFCWFKKTYVLIEIW